MTFKKSNSTFFGNSALKIQCHIVKNTTDDFAHWVTNEN